MNNHYIFRNYNGEGTMEKRSSAGKVKLIYYLLFFYEGRGHWNVSYTGTKSFIITKSLGTFI